MLGAIGKQLKVATIIADEIFSELPLQQWMMFLYVCRDEEVDQVDFQKLLGVPGGTVSRNLARLGTKLVEDRDGKVKDIGYGLLEVRPDSTDTKKNVILLSKKGREIRDKIFKVLNNGTEV